MSSDKTESFCYKFLSKVSGIEKKTIDILIDNGFGSVHSILVITDEDLNQMSDISLGQKAILRKELQQLLKEYNLMKAGTHQNNTHKLLLEEYLTEDDGCPPESPINTSNNFSHNIEVITEMTSTPNPSTKDSRESAINNEGMTVDGQQSFINSQPLIVERRETHINGQPLTVTERFGLRPPSERKKKKLLTDEEDTDNTPKNEELWTSKSQISRQTKSCKVCDRKTEGRDTSFCNACRSFYKYYKQREQQLVCDKDGKCLAKKNSQNKCRSCRWNKCLEVRENLDSGHSSGNTSLQSLSLNLSDESLDQFDENTGHKRTQQPNIDLTPIKVNVSHKSNAKISHKKLQKKCAICGDVANKRGFGVICCSACISFFKRAHTNQTGDWKCVQSDDNCEISPKSKNKCRLCRYNCCLRAGMTFNDQTIGNGRQQNGGQKMSQPKENVTNEELATQGDSDQNTEVEDDVPDLSAPTDDDYASIECGTTPESPKLNKTKRRKY